MMHRKIPSNKHGGPCLAQRRRVGRPDQEIFVAQLRAARGVELPEQVRDDISKDFRDADQPRGRRRGRGLGIQYREVLLARSMLRIAVLGNHELQDTVRTWRIFRLASAGICGSLRLS
jgi:hypothetical protein